jgi:hypothetical protein
MRLPDFVLSLDSRAVIRITEPSFELRIVADQEIPDLPHPQIVCEFDGSTRFGVVKWLGDPDHYRIEELERFAARGAEYLLDRWNDKFPA